MGLGSGNYNLLNVLVRRQREVEYLGQLGRAKQLLQLPRSRLANLSVVKLNRLHALLGLAVYLLDQCLAVVQPRLSQQLSLFARRLYLLL